MLTTLVIAESEDRKSKLVEKLIKLKVDSVAGSIGQDCMWVANGVKCIGDIKTPSDFMASYNDGRLHKQLFEEAGFKFILIEGAWSRDGGWTVGNKSHGWSWNAFDNARATLHLEGVFTALCHTTNQTSRRLAELYKWTENHIGVEFTGAWHRPEVKKPVKIRDVRRESQVGLLMHLPYCGQKKAEILVDTFGVLGTMDAVVNNIDILLSIPGLGKKTVDGWREYLIDNM